MEAAPLIQSGLLASLAEPIAERVPAERRALERLDERHLRRRHSGEDARQLGVDRDREHRVCLLLPQVQDSVPDVLAPHPDDVAPPLAGVEPERLYPRNLSGVIGTGFASG